jgi:hypothetical protein
MCAPLGVETAFTDALLMGGLTFLAGLFVILNKDKIIPKEKKKDVIES